jgi:hypothetical protein
MVMQLTLRLFSSLNLFSLETVRFMGGLVSSSFFFLLEGAGAYKETETGMALHI